MAFTFISAFSCCILSVAGQIQFLSEAGTVRVSTKGPERQGRFCKSSSPSTKAHIKFRELSYHTSQIAKQKGCQYETDISRGKCALSVVVSSLKNVELLNFQPYST
jgi:hypothetical protein